MRRLFLDLELMVFPGLEPALKFHDGVTAGGELRAGIGAEVALLRDLYRARGGRS